MNSDFIFIHIPKNAGQSIKKVLGIKHRCTVNAFAHINNLGEDIFNSFFSFAFVRNPWDRQVSFYEFIRKTPSHHLHSKVKDVTFKEYIKFILPVWTMVNESQRGYIYSGPKQLVTFVGRFENLEASFNVVCEKLNKKMVLPKLNSTDHKHYSEYYDDFSIDTVSRIFRKDIITFNYKFGE